MKKILIAVIAVEIVVAALLAVLYPRSDNCERELAKALKRADTLEMRAISSYRVHDRERVLIKVDDKAKVKEFIALIQTQEHREDVENPHRASYKIIFHEGEAELCRFDLSDLGRLTLDLGGLRLPEEWPPPEKYLTPGSYSRVMDWLVEEWKEQHPET